MNELQNKLDAILLDKNTNLLAKNLAKGSKVLGIEGTYNGARLYANEEESLLDPNVYDVGTKGLFYGYSNVAVVDDETFNTIKPIKKSFTLTNAVISNTDIYCKSTVQSGKGTAGIYMRFTPTQAYIYFSGSYAGGWESADGLSYTPVDSITVSSGKSTTTYDIDWDKNYEWTGNGLLKYDSSVYPEGIQKELYEIFITMFDALTLKLNGVKQYSHDVYTTSGAFVPLKSLYFDSSYRRLYNSATNSEYVVLTTEAQAFVNEEYHTHKDYNFMAWMMIDEIKGREITKYSYFRSYEGGILGDIVYDDELNVLYFRLNYPHNEDKTRMYVIKTSVDLKTKTVTHEEIPLIKRTLYNGSSTYGDSFYVDYPITLSEFYAVSLTVYDSYVSLDSQADVYFTNQSLSNYCYCDAPSGNICSWVAAPTQFTLTERSYIIGDYSALGKDGEVKGDGSWKQKFQINGYESLFPEVFHVDTSSEQQVSRINHKWNTVDTSAFVSMRDNSPMSSNVYKNILVSVEDGTHADMVYEYHDNPNNGIQYGYSSAYTDVVNTVIPELDPYAEDIRKSCNWVNGNILHYVALVDGGTFVYITFDIQAGVTLSIQSVENVVDVTLYDSYAKKLNDTTVLFYGWDGKNFRIIIYHLDTNTCETANATYGTSSMCKWSLGYKFIDNIYDLAHMKGLLTWEKSQWATSAASVAVLSISNGVVTPVYEPAVEYLYHSINVIDSELVIATVSTVTSSYSEDNRCLFYPDTLTQKIYDYTVINGVTYYQLIENGEWYTVIDGVQTQVTLPEQPASANTFFIDDVEYDIFDSEAYNGTLIKTDTKESVIQAVPTLWVNAGEKYITLSDSIFRILGDPSISTNSQYDDETSDWIYHVSISMSATDYTARKVKLLDNTPYSTIAIAIPSDDAYISTGYKVCEL